MLILKKGHQPGVYVPLRALFLVLSICTVLMFFRLSKLVKKCSLVSGFYCKAGKLD